MSVANGRLMSVLLMAGGAPPNLRRSRGAGGQRVAKGEVHDHDLLLLVDDDLLGEPLQPLVLSVAELHERHVDRTLVVWDHHASEVAIRVAAEGDVHRRVHFGRRRRRSSSENHSCRPPRHGRAQRQRSRSRERRPKAYLMCGSGESVLSEAPWGLLSGVEWVLERTRGHAHPRHRKKIGTSNGACAPIMAYQPAGLP